MKAKAQECKCESECACTNALLHECRQITFEAYFMKLIQLCEDLRDVLQFGICKLSHEKSTDQTHSARTQRDSAHLEYTATEFQPHRRTRANVAIPPCSAL